MRLSHCWRSRLLAGLLMLPAIAGPVFGEPPEVSFLFPSGIQQGQSRSMRIHGKPGTPPLRIWTSDERLSAVPDETDEQIAVTAVADLPPGVHWVRVINDEGTSELLPVVVGVLAEVTEEQLQTDEGRQPPTLPTTISGVLSKSGEVDTYSVTLAAGATLIASIDSRRLLASPADIVLQLATERGFVVSQNDDHHGFDPQIVYTATESGSFTVRVFAFPADPNSTIRFAGGDNYTYRLTLTTGPFVDHLFPLAIAPKGETVFQQRGWNLSADETPVIATAQATGDILVASRHPGSLLANRWQPSTGPLLTELQVGENSEPLELPVPASVCGYLAETTTTDIYRFSAKKDQTLRLSVAAQEFDSPHDPDLAIRNADGKIIKADDDIAKGNADVRLDVKFPADGEYTAEVSDRFGHGGMRYVYLLNIEQPQPQFRLSVDQTRFAVTADKPLEIPVTIERQDGFGEAIVVKVEGLPAGITAEAVESAKEGETAKKVTVKIVSSGESPYGGTIRIVGTSEESKPVAATADTPIARLTVDEIWLTAVATKEDAKPKESEAAEKSP